MSFLDKPKKKQLKKITWQEISKKYSVIISFENNSILNIDLVSNEKKGSKFLLKDDFIFFSDSQKKILQYVREITSWGQKINVKDFFICLKKSEFKIYYQEENNIFKILFNQKKKIEKKDKISLEFFKATKSSFFPVLEKDFVFRVNNEKDFVIFSKRILFFDGNIFYVKDEKIFISKIDKNLKEILNRIIIKKYDGISGFFSERFETKLAEKQIIDINNIIKKSCLFFDLDTKLKADFIVKKSSTEKETISVDFDFEEKKLEIKILVDYGVKKIDISESVVVNVVSKQIEFSRNFNNFFGIDYIFNISDKNIFYAKINYKKEIEMYKYFFSSYKNFGFTQKLKLSKKGEKQVGKFLLNNWDNFKKLKYKIIFENQKFGSKILDFKANLNIKTFQDNDWLFFDAEFYLGKNKVSLAQLQKYVSGKTKYIAGDDGEIIKVKNKEELERFVYILNSFHQNQATGNFEGKLYSAIDLQNIFTSSPYYNVKMDNGFKKFISEAKSGKPIKSIKISKKYTDTLRDYQKDGIDWLHFLKKYHFGGILADDMGLGKTIQTLIMIALNIQKGKPSIVIVPKTLIGNWIEEAEKFVKNLTVLVVEGSFTERQKLIKNSKKFNLIITSYSFFQKDIKKYQEEKIVFNYAILDEAQYIKNFKTKNAQVVKQINSDYRLALTGTPLENSISEIWSIFEFLMPGFLGSQFQFAKNFILPISKNGDMEKLKDLKKKISIFMLRRTKNSVLKELPNKTIQKILIPLSDDQSILYQEILANIKKDILQNMNKDNFGKSYINILTALTKLRQICNHPNLILKTNDYKKYNSSKLDICLNLILEMKAEGRKVLIFSQFKSMLEILKNELKEKKIKHSYLVGETKDRKKLIDDFNSDKENFVFLISLKAGGVGINLTSADNVILFDPWWNPSVENQAIDRTHRIGQKNKVNVYKLITKGTIEQKILKLQKKKQGLFDSLIDDSSERLKKLSWDDILNLFN